MDGCGQQGLFVELSYWENPLFAADYDRPWTLADGSWEE
jgi:hypothetical protein